MEKNMIKYKEMKYFISNNYIVIDNINVFEELIQENNINNIFYGIKTEKDKNKKYFLFILNSVFYVFTYISEYGIYKNIDDYKNALQKHFTNADIYYLALKCGLENQKDITDYLFENYNISYSDIKNIYEKYEDFYNLIDEIENLKLKYSFNKDETIIYYYLENLNNLSNSFGLREINIKKIHSRCMDAIKINNITIFVSDIYINNISIFIQAVKNIMKKTEYKFNIIYETEYEDCLLNGKAGEVL